MGIWEIIAGPILKMIDKIIPDPQAKAAAQLQIIQMQQAGEFKELEAQLALAKGQTDINQAEASSGDKFTSRWRPTIGYVIGAAMAFQYVVNPLILWVAAIIGHNITPPVITLDAHLWELITGMLGLAGWRTLDKIKAAQ